MWYPIPIFPNLLNISGIFPGEPQATYSKQFQSESRVHSEMMLGLGRAYKKLGNIASAEYWWLQAVWFRNKTAAFELATFYSTNEGMGYGRVNTPELRAVLFAIGHNCPYWFAARGQIVKAIEARYPRSNAANTPIEIQ